MHLRIDALENIKKVYHVAWAFFGRSESLASCIENKQWQFTDKKNTVANDIVL